MNLNLNAGCKNNRNDINDDEVEAQMNDEDDEDNTEAEEYEEENEDDDEPDFMDNSGKCWEFASKIRDEKHLKEWCQNKMGGMIVGKEEKLTRQFHCKIKECQFKAILLKSCSIVYTRNKHNHQMENAKNVWQNEQKNQQISASKSDYVDYHGKLWTFHSQIGKNISQDIFRIKYGFTGMYNNNTTINLFCSKTNPTGVNCPYKGIYLKSNGYLYTRGERATYLSPKIDLFLHQIFPSPKIDLFLHQIFTSPKIDLFLHQIGRKFEFSHLLPLFSTQI